MSDLSWMKHQRPENDVDLSWIGDGIGEAPDRPIREMFAPPPPPEPPVAQPAAEPEPPGPPPPPPGPSPEELRLRAECAALVQETARAVEALQEAARLEVGRTAELITEMGLFVAEELAAGAIEADENRLVALIIEALEMLNAEREVTVYISPVMYEKLSEAGHIDGLRKEHHLTIRAEAKIVDSGCIVDSPVGQVDARVRSRLRQLRHLLAEKQGARES